MFVITRRWMRKLRRVVWQSKILEHRREEYDLRAAVLYRTNSQSRVFEEAMRRAGLPYNIVGGFSFYERMEVRDIIAYLKLALNPNDSIASRASSTVRREESANKHWMNSNVAQRITKFRCGKRFRLSLRTGKPEFPGNQCAQKFSRTLVVCRNGRSFANSVQSNRTLVQQTCAIVLVPILPRNSMTNHVSRFRLSCFRHRSRGNSRTPVMNMHSARNELTKPKRVWRTCRN